MSKRNSELCGAAMVRRRAVKGANAGGEFWGCSNYPKCRGISSIEKQHFTDAASSV
ncbi:MAG: topoisomerase DNA-binding C4 zinc finger domain-containing protein [Oscillospiraceae bacterium]